MSEIHYQPYDIAGNKIGEIRTNSTTGYSLSPAERKRKTIDLLERVQRGEVTPIKAFELLKEIV